MKSLKKNSLIFCLIFCSFLFSKNVALAAGSNYYLSAAGNNASLGTSIANAWATLDHGCGRLQAGDTLYVMEGAYSDQHCVLANSGTEGGKITITGYDSNSSKPVFDGLDKTGVFVDFNGKSYINVSGLRVINYSLGLSVDSYIGVKQLNISDMEVVHTAGSAIQLSNFVRDSVIKNCTVEDNGWNSIAILGENGNLSDPDRYTHNITIEDCTTLPPYGHAAIDLFGDLSDIKILNNTIQGGTIFSHRTQGSSLLMSNIQIIGNHIYESASQSINVNADDSIFKDNIIRNSTLQGIYTDLPVTNLTVENNTVYGTVDGTGIWVAGNNINILNNNVYDNGDYPDYRINQGDGIIRNLIGASVNVVAVGATTSVSLEFTNGKFFKGSGSEISKYYNNKSAYQFYGSMDGVGGSFIVYPAYAVPTSGYLTITIGTINKDTDTWDFTSTSSVPENVVTFTFETLHTNTIYSVRIDNIEIATANTDGTGKLIYSYQVEGNEFDTTHNFKFVSTGVAVPSAHSLTITNGTGSGSYIQNQSVTITANPPAIGKEFDKWTGDTASVSDINSSTTTVTMPSSAVSLTAAYKDTTAAATPAFSPAAGTYTSTQTVTITSTTSGATIYYTTNGNTPTSSSIPYTGAIAISSTTTLKAIAVKTGLTNSSISSATFTITPTTTGSTGGTTGTTGGGGTTPITPTITKVEITKTEGNILTLSFNVTNATQMMLSDNSNFVGSAWEVYASTKTYTKQLTQTKLYLKFKSSDDTISSTLELTIPATITNPSSGGDTPTPYPTGTLLKLSDSFKVYVIIGGNKKWIPTPEVFEQQGYKWTEIKILTQTELNTIPDYEDNLIRAINDYKVYLVVNGVKRHIPNPIIFLDYGFKWEEVKDVPQTTIDNYKNTYLIKQSGTSGIYYVNPQEIRKLIPSTEVFNSYNDKTEDI